MDFSTIMIIIGLAILVPYGIWKSRQPKKK